MNDISKLESEKNAQLEVIGNLHNTLLDIRKYAEFDRQITGRDYFSPEFITIITTVQEKLHREESTLSYLRTKLQQLELKVNRLLRS
jgi:hypothetical protein